MDYNSAFSVGSPYDMMAYFASSSLRDLDDHEIMAGRLRPEFAVPFRRKWGRSPMDVIWTDSLSLVAISDRVLQLLRNERVTGWTTYSVNLQGSGNHIFRGYQGLAIIGRCGTIDPSRSERFIMPPPPRHPSSTPGWEMPPGRASAAWRGIYFKDDYWDGSDIFQPNDGMSWFVVERVKLAMERAQITNVTFRRLSEIEGIVPT